MKKIPIEKIEDGMILARPVLGSGGNVLLSEGIVLKAALVSRLKNWDIPSVSIQSEENDAQETGSIASPAFKSQKLDDLFKGVLDDPIMKIVYDATKEHFASK